jgi:hypothetical protein
MCTCSLGMPSTSEKDPFPLPKAARSGRSRRSAKPAAAALLYVAGFGHFIAGNVDMGAVGWLLIGSIPGVLIGSQLTLSIPERLLRGVLATVLGLAGLRLLNVPGATVAIVVVLAAGMIALLVYIARRSWAARHQQTDQPELAPELVEQE